MCYYGCKFFESKTKVIILVFRVLGIDLISRDPDLATG